MLTSVSVAMSGQLLSAAGTPALNECPERFEILSPNMGSSKDLTELVNSPVVIVFPLV